jgi:hypothetical protein
MHDPNGYRSVKNQKSVKSTDFFFLIMLMTCILIYQGIAGLDVFTSCLLTHPHGYYLSWIVFLVSLCFKVLVSESELFPIGV